MMVGDVVSGTGDRQGGCAYVGGKAYMGNLYFPFSFPIYVKLLWKVVLKNVEVYLHIVKLHILVHIL